MFCKFCIKIPSMCCSCVYLFYRAPFGSMDFHRMTLCSFSSMLRVIVLFESLFLPYYPVDDKLCHYTMLPPPCFTVGKQFSGESVLFFFHLKLEVNSKV